VSPTTSGFLFSSSSISTIRKGHPESQLKNPSTRQRANAFITKHEQRERSLRRL
jgi:hypothetical protein